MASTSLAPLLLFVLIATVSPGGATTLATASGASFGYRRSLPLIAGITAGLASMAAAAAAGLGGVLLALPTLQLVMRLASTAYLLWLAWQIARRGAPQQGGKAVKPVGFLAGLWMLWHNPKGWAMTMGAAASFAGVADGPWHLGLLLGSIFGCFAAASLSLWCVTGLMLGRALRTTAQWRVLNGILGLLLASSTIAIWF